MHSKSPLLCAFATLLSVAKVAAAAECTHFETNGTIAAVYDFYRFYDFRHIEESADNGAASGSADNISKIVSAAPWNAGWVKRDWLRPAAKKVNVDMNYKPSESWVVNNTNDASDDYSTYLTLQTRRLQNGTQLAAELDFHEHNVTYASLRFSARVRGESGAIAGFFTYHNDTSESDIEIPSGGSGEEMHCSNQPTEDPATDKPIKDATFNVSMEKHQPTLTWNNYRLDWVNGRTVWYTNGVQSADTRVNVPDDSSMIILNMWSNGGPFSGRMDKGGKAWLDIQWVELLFNSTSSQKSVSLNDGTLCSTEESLGAPEESAASRSGFGGSYFWLVIGLVSVLASGSLTT